MTSTALGVQGLVQRSVSTGPTQLETISNLLPMHFCTHVLYTQVVARDTFCDLCLKALRDAGPTAPRAVGGLKVCDQFKPEHSISGVGCVHAFIHNGHGRRSCHDRHGN